MQRGGVTRPDAGWLQRGRVARLLCAGLGAPLADMARDVVAVGAVTVEGAHKEQVRARQAVPHRKRILHVPAH